MDDGESPHTNVWQINSLSILSLYLTILTFFLEIMRKKKVRIIKYNHAILRSKNCRIKSCNYLLILLHDGNNKKRIVNSESEFISHSSYLFLNYVKESHSFEIKSHNLPFTPRWKLTSIKKHTSPQEHTIWGIIHIWRTMFNLDLRTFQEEDPKQISCVQFTHSFIL